MKKALIIGSLIGFLVSVIPATANNGGGIPVVVSTTSPTVSIGLGNGNTPNNTGPAHESAQTGSFDVFATVEDENLESYHFRVVKDGEIDGSTCLGFDNALFASENQGYASSTLGKDACGFNYNQSIYTAASFVNQIIATLNVKDLEAFNGLGDYWLILGARDTSGNRSATDYLNDPKIKITIASSTPVVETPTDTNSNSGGSPSTGSGSSSGGLGGRRHDIGGIFGTGGIGNAEVLGASTGPMCEEYLKEYIKFGADNNREEVKKLQIFLNQFFEVNNPVTGFYGPITLGMVNKFQVHQQVAILLPWEIAGLPTYGPTGYVYKTTKRWVNILKCPESILNTPIPALY